MKDAEFKFMYQNHSYEWERQPDGRLMLAHFLDGMPEDVIGIMLDMYWLQFTGANPLAWIEKLQNRLQCVHLKDMSVKDKKHFMMPVGEENMDYPAIIAKLKECGKTEYLLVEQDEYYDRDPFDCLKSSYDYLQSLTI